jgi:hypothetical protein
MRVRCPHCRKLYLVQFADVKESKPKFECIQCRSKFWLSLPDMDLSAEITGIPVHVKDVPRPAGPRPAADPAAAGGSVDADSGVALSAVAGTVAGNYAICHDAIAEVKRWREWYADFSAQWEKLRAKLKE